VTPEEQARFEALERRVGELERRLAGPAPLPRLPLPPVPPPRFTEPERTAAPLPDAAPPRSISGGEMTVGLNWISRIAVVTVALALAFFFQYAFENHWINETARIAIGVACGLAALAGGEIFHRREQRTYGQALAAAGIAFLYLSFWAAFNLYHLLPQAAAFALMILTTVAAGFAALRYDSLVVALLGLAGGYATPGLLSTGGHHPWFVLSYALLLSSGAVAMGRARGWLSPQALAIAGNFLLYTSQLPAEPAYAAFLAAYYAVFAASGNVAIFVAALVLAIPAMAAVWSPGETGLWLAWLLSAASLAIGDRRRWPLVSAAAFAAFWIGYALWYGPSGFTPLFLLTMAYALFLAWPVWRAQTHRELNALDLLGLTLNAAFYFGSAYGLLRESYDAWVGLFVVGLAAAQAAVARLLWRAEPRGALLSAATAWVLLVLAAPIQFTGYRITVSWAAEAAAMVWIGVRLAERRAVYAAMWLFAVAGLRLAYSDSFLYAGRIDYSLLFNARFIAFAAVAIGLWASSWWLSEGRLGGGAYLGGHIAMLWGFSLEAAGWAGRTASPENFRSVASTAISVVAAAYAVLLVGGGAAQRHTFSRQIGIGIIGLVVLKLYLYDVWLLGGFYRMAAFAILGGMLLVMSYLYSRRAGHAAGERPAPRAE
jgi:hypothetical protein